MNVGGPVESVIVLDLDDTLYLEREYVLSGFAAVGYWLEENVGLRHFAETAAAVFAEGGRGDIFDQALARLGARPSSGLVRRLVALYREHHPSISLAPDAARFLLRQRPRSALALLTDGNPVSQRNKIRALGLDKGIIFPIVCTGDWGREYWKPHQRGFRHIEAFHARSRPSFAYIADNPAKDFIAPRTMGWRTVQITRPGAIHDPHNPEPADLAIESLDELTDDHLEWLTPRRCA